MSATEQGAAAAHNLLHGDVQPFSPAVLLDRPVRRKDPGSQRLPGRLCGQHRRGTPGDGRFVALYRKGGQLAGVLGWNAPARVLPYRKLLLEQQMTVG